MKYVSVYVVGIFV